MDFKIYKLKPKKEKVWQEWSLLLKQKSEEVLITLAEEGLVFEGSLTFSYKNAKFVCLFGKKDPKACKNSKVNYNREINISHKTTKKECFEETYIPIEINYFFER